MQHNLNTPVTIHLLLSPTSLQSAGQLPINRNLLFRTGKRFFYPVRIRWLQSWRGLWCNLPAFLLQFQVKAKSVQSDLVIQKEQSI
ncbi:hypothetical protein L1987_80108 [Smallanthus sonchifolius]|uniref:Uncharacterized protein n=1 Tax=Smallanthus sonchifolius TaxID=185202 RepID=A0ACB8YLP3_9ASTR|nr:hypothetical protein L1987_80108 [Smallanthus sonchifolius]